jgi:hypothetical protein
MVAEVLIQHVTKCKEIPQLQYAFPIIIPEANMATLASELQRTLKYEFKFKCQFMTEDKRKGAKKADMPGIYTTGHNKNDMIHLFMNNYLKKGRVFMYPNFVVAASEGEEITCGYGSIKGEFESELREFSRVRRLYRAPDGTENPKFFYHGKIDGNDDDFVMALVIAPFAYRIFSTSGKYSGVRAL